MNGWDIYTPCDSSLANVQRGLLTILAASFKSVQCRSSKLGQDCHYSEEHTGCDGLRSKEGRKQQGMLWSTLQHLDFEGWIWLNFLTSFWLGRRQLQKRKPISSQTTEGLTLSIEPLSVRVELDSYWQRGGETSNIMEIFVKEHISWKAYPADVPNISLFILGI